MESDKDAASSSKEGPNHITDAPDKPLCAKPAKKSINLLKRSKHDLLRLLSILEGELEARDIFISTLQAQISNQRNAREKYFVHRLTDPFLSLHRDDYIAEGGDQKEGRIEPLPLLEKVVHQFKTQQLKMHQQMALASKIHRKMAHELAEEKRKHAVDTKTGDDVTMALEKERERLKAGILHEKARTKRIESEYKKLLQLCRQEGKKHKVIVLMLLEEQQRLMQQLKESKELQIDLDSTETELQARLHEALKEKHDLATRLRERDVQCSELKVKCRDLHEQVERLKMSQKSAAKPTPALQQALALYNCEDDSDNEEAPELPAKLSKNSLSGEDDVFPEDPTEPPPLLAKHHPMSVAQSSQDVTLIPTSCHPPILLADGVEGVTTSGYYSVKPGSAIAGLEAMKSNAQSKEILDMEPPSEPVHDVPDGKASSMPPSPQQIPTRGPESPMTLNLQPQPPASTGPPKPNRFVPSSPLYSLSRSPQPSFLTPSHHLPMTSSPTSGAANFAMNSPNASTPPYNSPFSVSRPSVVKPAARAVQTKPEIAKSPSAPTKSIITKPPSPGRPGFKPMQSSQFQATRQKFLNSTLSQTPQSNKKEQEAAKSIPPKENHPQGDKRIAVKKFAPSNYKSHITQKVSPSTSLPNVPLSKLQIESSGTEAEKVKPLPPKTRPSTTPSPGTEQARPPPLPPKKPSLSSEKSIKRVESKKMEPTVQRKITSVKRPVPLNPSSKMNSTAGSNSNGNNNNTASKRVKGPVPPSLPAKMSSQQPAPPASPRYGISAQQRLFPASSGSPTSPAPSTKP